MEEVAQKFITLIVREYLVADHDTISQALLQRRQYMPIYVGNGLPIPH